MTKFLLKVLEFITNGENYRTGTKAPFSGVYRSGNEYVPLAKDERFPPSITDWKLVVQL